MVGFGQSRERAERLVKLASALGLGAPRTLVELRDRFGLYGESDVAMRRQFLRDKDDLAESGVVVETIEVGDGPAYWIRRRSQRIVLTPEELDVLAVLGATISDPVTGAALATLAGGAGQFPADAAGGRVALDKMVLPASVMTALVESRQLVLAYRDATGGASERTVEPWELVHRRGLTYLVCWDLDRAAVRNFRLDRLVGEPALGGPAVQPRPTTPTGPVHPTDRHDFEVLAPVDARIDLAEMGGSVTSTTGAMITGAFVQYRSEPVLGWALRHQATITSPPAFAHEHRRRLEHLLEVHVGTPSHVDRPATPKARAQTLSVERVRRLMLLPTFLGEMAGVTRDELARTLGCTLEELDVELELLDSVELPGHGSVGEVSEVGGQLVYHRHLHDPDVELTAADAMRLLLLVEILAPLMDDITAGLESIRTKLRGIVPALIHVDLAGAHHPDLDLLRHAIRDRDVVRFEYRGRKDRAWRDRQVAPDQFRVANGAVYLAGVDVVSGEERQFRLDRMGPVEVAGKVPLLAAESTTPRYVPTDPEVEVLLLLNTASSWLLTRMTPVVTEARDDGTVVAVIRTDAVEWLASHVMAAGGQAEVVSPPKVRALVAGRAQAVLDR